MRAPLAVPAIVVWIVAVGAILLDGAAVWAAVALWSATAVAILIRRRSGRGGMVVVALAMAAACASHVAATMPSRAEAVLDIGGGRAIVVRAHVSSKVEGADGMVRFDADAVEVAAGDRVYSVAIPVAVRGVPEVSAGLDLGAEVLVRGTARPADRGEREVIVVFASRGVEVVRPPPGLLAVAADLRNALVARAADLPQPGGGLLPGLAVGDTRAVDVELDTAMKATSLSHLTAVSGANCAIVVGVAFGAMALMGARRGVRIGVALTALGGFVLLVTPEPSVVRAGAMAAIAMTALALGRRAQGVAVLSLAVVVLLIADPWLALSLGFALSAAATAALLLLAPGLARGLSRWMPRPLAIALSVPLSTQLACGPLLVLINPALPVYSVPANLLAEPAAPLATVIGLAACLAAPIPVLADGLTAVAWVPASWIANTALTIARFPAGSIGWVEGWAGAALLALVGAALVWTLTRLGHDRTADRVLRRIVVVATAALTGCALGAAVLRGPVGLATSPQDWAIAACDVGQGDAVLVRSAGRVALIDTGPAPEPLTDCLDRLGVGRLDLLVLTHFDLDHRGGVAAVAGRVDLVLHGPADSAEDAAVIADLAANGAGTVLAEEGMSGALGDASWRVLWPGGRATPGNDASVVVDVHGGGVPASVYLGDLSAQAQQELAATGRLEPPYAVVKVAHHGSADQDAALYRRLHGAVTLLTVGLDNDYGHPRASTLALLKGTGASIPRTDRDGLVLIAERDGDLAIWREHAGEAVGAAQ